VTASVRPPPPAHLEGHASMQDLLWVAMMVGLLAATLAYVRLCDTI
jgi:hypothetical protein